MNDLTKSLQAAPPVEFMKEGVLLAEAPLKVLMKGRMALIARMYDSIQNHPKGHPDYAKEQSVFKRIKAEEAMLEAIAGYMVAIDGLLDAQTLENQELREKSALRGRVMYQLRQKLSDAKLSLFLLKHSPLAKITYMNMVVDHVLLRDQIKEEENR